MEIEVWSVGKAKFTADAEYQEPMIREAIDQRGDVAGVIADYTDTERSNIDCDEYVRVTGDLPGLVLFEGWLTGDRDAPPPPTVTPSACGHAAEISRLRGQLQAVRAVAEPYAGEVKFGASSTTVLATAILDQLDPE
jgi:hypothetical protein